MLNLLFKEMFIKRGNMKNWQRLKIQYNNTIGKGMGMLTTSNSADRSRFVIAIKMTKTQTVFDSAIAFLEIRSGEMFTCVSVGHCSQVLTIPCLFQPKARNNLNIHQWERFG